MTLDLFDRNKLEQKCNIFADRDMIMRRKEGRIGGLSEYETYRSCIVCTRIR